MSGQPIKMNDLIPVRFTPLDPSLDRVALLNRQVSVLSSFVKLNKVHFTHVLFSLF